MRIRLRNLNEFTTYNFLLVKESTLVNPDKNIISVESPLGKILQYAQVGEAFTCNGQEYSILDISPTPRTRQQA
jgi:transcription elongation GreA/GreB family factor